MKFCVDPDFLTFLLMEFCFLNVQVLSMCERLIVINFLNIQINIQILHHTTYKYEFVMVFSL